MRSIAIAILIGFSFYACSYKVDSSNPESVAVGFVKIIADSKLELAYDLIADTCKGTITLHDFLNSYKEDSLQRVYKFEITNVRPLSFENTYPNYRAFEIFFKSISEEMGDTVVSSQLITTIKEKDRWQVVWSDIQVKSAQKLEDYGRYSEAIDALFKVVDLDPFNEDVYRSLGWCYFRLGLYEDALRNANTAINLRPDYGPNYNILAAIYSSKGNQELAVAIYTKALMLTKIETDKVYLLSNLCFEYLSMNDYDNAMKSVNMSLRLDSLYTHAWFGKGSVYTQTENLDSAIYCFSKAVGLKPLENYLQKQLCYDYSSCLLNMAKMKPDKKSDYLMVSNQYILKAMELDPENQDYKDLLREIENLQ